MRIVAVVLFILALVGAGYALKAQHDALTSKLAAVQLDDAQAHADLAQAQRDAKMNAHIDASATVATAQLNTVYKTITKEVTRYVASNPHSCTLDADWVRIHNDAATARVDVPAAARPADASTGTAAVPAGQ